MRCANACLAPVNRTGKRSGVRSYRRSCDRRQGLYGGQGKILRAIIGVITTALTGNFLNLARIGIFRQGLATGTIILGVEALHAASRSPVENYPVNLPLEVVAHESD
jgi:hypothetical protein